MERLKGETVIPGMRYWMSYEASRYMYVPVVAFCLEHVAPSLKMIPDVLIV